MVRVLAEDHLPVSSTGMTTAPPVVARLLRVTGVVQGVGFRPFVHRLAARHALGGWVRNVAGTVEIHVEGDADQLDAFQRELLSEAPRVSQIDTVDRSPASPIGAYEFVILASTDADGNRPVSADLSICAECEAELFDPANRRHEHPFITCTHCGPRFTIIRSLPYDRERTSMSAFEMCPRCEAEYFTPTNRRHHAETVACHDCGPLVWLANSHGVECSERDAAIRD